MTQFKQPISTPTYTITVIGDSLTNDYGLLGVRPSELWTYVLQKKLNNESGCDVKIRNFGKSGNHTYTGSSGAQTRMNSMFRYDVPNIAIIELGSNDTGSGMFPEQTKINLQALIEWTKFGCIGSLPTGSEENLPCSNPGDRYVVYNDNSTTGGAARPNYCTTKMLPTLTGSYSASLSVWECRYGFSGSRGWGRIANSASIPDVVDKIIVMGSAFQNYSGGDTTQSAYPTYAFTRAAQSASVLAESGSASSPYVVYCDLWNFQRNRIVSGSDAQWDSKWNFEYGNQHFNKYGQSVIAQCVYECIKQYGWESVLR